MIVKLQEIFRASTANILARQTKRQLAKLRCNVQSQLEQGFHSASRALARSSRRTITLSKTTMIQTFSYSMETKRFSQAHATASERVRTFGNFL